MLSRARFGAGLVAAALAAAVAAASAPASGAIAQPAASQARPAAVTVNTALGKPAGKPPKEDLDPVVKAAAKRFGLPERRIEQGLMDVKRYLSKQQPSTKDKKSKPVDVDLLSPAVVKVFAKSLGVPTSRARAVLKFLMAGWEKAGKGGKPGKPPAEESAAAVKFLAGELHISKAQAEKVWATLQKMERVSEKDPAFIALARSLHVTPKQLMAVLMDLKKYLGSLQPKPGEPKPGEPKPGEPKPGEPKPGEPKPPAPVKP
jgi:hypothetical protein